MNGRTAEWHRQGMEQYRAAEVQRKAERAARRAQFRAAEKFWKSPVVQPLTKENSEASEIFMLHPLVIAP
jgi:hypothetical protein